MREDFRFIFECLRCITLGEYIVYTIGAAGIGMAALILLCLE